MSGIQIVRALLMADAALVAKTPSAKVFTGVIPQGTQAPALGIMQISGTDFNTLARSPVAVRKVKVFDRVQVTAIGVSLPDCEAVLLLVRHALRQVYGITVSIPGGPVWRQVTCRLDGRGPQFQAETAGFYMQTQDTLVTFDEIA